MLVNYNLIINDIDKTISKTGGLQLDNLAYLCCCKEKSNAWDRCPVSWKPEQSTNLSQKICLSIALASYLPIILNTGLHFFSHNLKSKKTYLFILFLVKPNQTSHWDVYFTMSKYQFYFLLQICNMFDCCLLSQTSQWLL